MSCPSHPVGAHLGATAALPRTAVAPRCAPTHVRISINDVGATPAVVSLRLEQALDVLQGAAV
ncbi:hypothetical protein [Xanthomonas maliensis]|uniref:hypothetical protein n=1 Tax=Xanthomonas maliensis TaxID=1321368 RepID=UPI003CCD4DA7